MERQVISNEKEVLFVPPPSEAVVRVENHFKDKGLRFSWVEDHQQLLDRLKALPPFLLILDLSRWDGSVLQMLPQFEGCRGDCKTIIFGEDGGLQGLAGDTLKNIVFFEDVLNAPVLSTALKSILEKGWGFFERNCVSEKPYHLLFSHSNSMEKVKGIIDQVAPTDITVLIEGESGTGKELMAQAIHSRSLRHTKPFVKVNCAAIPRELLESELFGFEKGAFTGASSRKPGKFELANEGTIFLDEIENIDSSSQSKLLQVLQDREFSPLGGRDSVAVDTRIIACTKSGLRDAVEAGRFREDLYYRLNVVRIELPPLRERKEEISSLIRYFLNLYSVRFGRRYPRLSQETEKVFSSYDWPGNIRQLQNTIKRIVILKEEEPVVREILGQMGEAVDSPALASSPSQLPEEEGGNLKEVGRRAAKRVEKDIIGKMLAETRWNRRKTAELLQISYKALLYKIKEYSLD
jgi:DNA-binding NtrC family response regulator